MRAAVFLDRDGTLIEDPGYLGDPARVALLPGVAGAVRSLNNAGIPVIVVTNQSGIARGLLSEEAYQATAGRLENLLAESGARVDAQYHCPHLPEISGPCECRKPGTLLYRQAADRLQLDLGRSFYVGDRARDAAPAEALGGHAILLTDRASADDRGLAATRGWEVATALPDAVERLILPRCR